MNIDESIIRENWFPKNIVFSHHVITRHLTYDYFETLRWKDPDSTYFMVDYILKNATLFVSGDIGDAVYRWSSSFSLRGISKCNLGYFHEKCTASELGWSTTNYEWDEDLAKKTIKEHFEDHSTPEKYAEFKKLSPPLYNRHEFVAWTYYNNVQEIFDDIDFWEWGYNCGNIIAPRTFGHLVGLRMAFEQIDKKEKECSQK